MVKLIVIQRNISKHDRDEVIKSDEIKRIKSFEVRSCCRLMMKGKGLK
jgi:hypothetical protein